MALWFSRFTRNQPLRLPCVARYATDDSNAALFELPPMVVLHTAAAWQEAPKIVKLAACCFDEVLPRHITACRWSAPISLAWLGMASKHSQPCSSSR